jgi:multidrug efflux pump subunit AcrA (membrane-fusion protein)
VPLSAIYHQVDGKPAVWVYDASAGKVELRTVELGPYREDGAVIAKGLANGEWIVAAGVNKLKEGQSVKPYEAPGKPAPPLAAPGHQLPAGPVARSKSS